MASSQSFHLASELEVAFDLLIIQYAEAIDNGSAAADRFHDLIRLEIEVGLMRNCKDNNIGTLHRFEEVSLNAQLF